MWVVARLYLDPPPPLLQSSSRLSCWPVMSSRADVRSLAIVCVCVCVSCPIREAGGFLRLLLGLDLLLTRRVLTVRLCFGVGSGAGGGVGGGVRQSSRKVFSPYLFLLCVTELLFLLFFGDCVRFGGRSGSDRTS